MGTADGAAGGDVFVVVREAGERTAGAVRSLAAAEVGEDAVATIREVPFAAALRRGLEIGAEAGRAWTLCLDADVLLRPGAVSALVAAAEDEAARDPALFGVSGQVADALLGQVRVAGNSLYLTRRIGAALATGEFRDRKRRPETHLKRVMAAAGHPWREVPVRVGLHDDEQYFRDIFRTVFAHNRKHGRFVPYAARYWARTAPRNPDHRVALWSLRIAEMLDDYAPRPGAGVDENVAIDVRQFAPDIAALLTPAGMREKDPLPPGAITAAEVGRRMDAFEVSPEFRDDLPLIEAERRGGWRARIAGLRRHPGARAAAARLAGRLMPLPAVRR